LSGTNLKELQRNWEGLAKIDPLWAILTHPGKRGRWKIEEFFIQGQRAIDDLMKHIDSLHVNIKRQTAMDFGCGVGRLSQALTHYFNRVCGVDIAPTMIELARKYNQYPNKCKFYLNETDDLKVFEDSSFNLVYSTLTLQHMEKKYIVRYLREFFRITTQGGLVVFQLPSSPPFRARLLGPIYWRLPYYHSLRFGGKIEMHTVEKDEILELARICGGTVVEALPEFARGWRGHTYYVTKD
jgi:ubiquinone/menaquinone biosynthesis C-methylase UbiE